VRRPKGFAACQAGLSNGEGGVPVTDSDGYLHLHLEEREQDHSSCRAETGAWTTTITIVESGGEIARGSGGMKRRRVPADGPRRGRDRREGRRHPGSSRRCGRRAPEQGRWPTLGAGGGGRAARSGRRDGRGRPTRRGSDCARRQRAAREQRRPHGERTDAGASAHSRHQDEHVGRHTLLSVARGIRVPARAPIGAEGFKGG
jgi:hypothetical protein